MAGQAEEFGDDDSRPTGLGFKGLGFRGLLVSMRTCFGLGPLGSRISGMFSVLRP